MSDEFPNGFQHQLDLDGGRGIPEDVAENHKLGEIGISTKQGSLSVFAMSSGDVNQRTLIPFTCKGVSNGNTVSPEDLRAHGWQGTSQLTEYTKTKVYDFESSLIRGCLLRVFKLEDRALAECLEAWDHDKTKGLDFDPAPVIEVVRRYSSECPKQPNTVYFSSASYMRDVIRRVDAEGTGVRWWDAISGGYQLHLGVFDQPDDWMWLGYVSERGNGPCNILETTSFPNRQVVEVVLREPTALLRLVLERPQVSRVHDVDPDGFEGYEYKVSSQVTFVSPKKDYGILLRGL